MSRWSTVGSSARRGPLHSARPVDPIVSTRRQTLGTLAPDAQPTMVLTRSLPTKRRSGPVRTVSAAGASTISTIRRSSSGTAAEIDVRETVDFMGTEHERFTECTPRVREPRHPFPATSVIGDDDDLDVGRAERRGDLDDERSEQRHDGVRGAGDGERLGRRDDHRDHRIADVRPSSDSRQLCGRGVGSRRVAGLDDRLQHDRPATEPHPHAVPTDAPTPHEAPFAERVVDQVDQVRISSAVAVAGEAVMIAEPSLEVRVSGPSGSTGARSSTNHRDDAHHPGGERCQCTDERDDGEHRLAEHDGQDHGTESRHTRADERRRRRERLGRRGHREADRIVDCIVGRRRAPSQFAMPGITGRRPDGRSVDVVADCPRRHGGRCPKGHAAGTDRHHVARTDLDTADVVDDGC